MTYCLERSITKSNLFVITDFQSSHKMSLVERKPNLVAQYANNKDTDQYAHPRYLISAFVIRWLESIFTKLALCESSNILTSLCSMNRLP